MYGRVLFLLFVSLLLFVLDDNFLVEFADNVGSVHDEVSGIFDFGEDGSVVILALTLNKDSFVDHKFVHSLNQILFR